MYMPERVVLCSGVPAFLHLRNDMANRTSRDPFLRWVKKEGGGFSHPLPSFQNLTEYDRRQGTDGCGDQPWHNHRGGVDASVLAPAGDDGHRDRFQRGITTHIKSRISFIKTSCFYQLPYLKYQIEKFLTSSCVSSTSFFSHRFVYPESSGKFT